MSYKLYDILGVSRTATIDEIKQTYRKRAITEHPDKGGDSEKFKELTSAYSVLSDPQEKERYDISQKVNVAVDNDNGYMNMNNIFSQMFGMGFPFGNYQQSAQPSILKDFIYTLNISQKEAFFGTGKIIKINLTKICFECIGKCTKCNGTGQVTESTGNNFFMQVFQKTCPECQGKKVSKKYNECSKCFGRGDTTEEIVLNVKVPAGVYDDYKISFQGYGEQKRTEDEMNGNFIVVIKVEPDPVFSRRGNDLVYIVPIEFMESIVGKKITIPYYLEEKMEIDIKHYTIIQPHKEYRILGRGMPILDSHNSSGIHFGDMILIFDINYSVTEETRKLFAELKI